MSAFPTLLTSFLDSSADGRGDAPALRDSRRDLTFAEVRRAAWRVAAELADGGVGPGDRVAIVMANSAAFGIAFWGVLYAGAVAVPLNPGTRSAKLAWIFGNCSPAAILCDDDLERLVTDACGEAGIRAHLLVHGKERGPGSLDLLIDGTGGTPVATGRVIDRDLAAIIYTSGSTGEPKGVMLSHLNMTSAARSVAQYLDYRSDDLVFCAIPLTFDYGLHQLTMTTLVGACLYVEPSFAQPFFALQHLAQSRASVFPVVPTMVPLIAPLAGRFDLTAVRCITSTAAMLHVDGIDTLTALFPGARLFSMYGLTECHRCTYLDPSELDRRKSSVGKAIPNTELWVVDEAGVAHRRDATGELVIRGSTVMNGYWKNPEKTAQKLRPGPWPGELVLYTGDICRLDGEGFLYFISRSDEILKVAGEKVAPSEVEAVLSAHPAVAEVCVLGIDHPVYGQQCCAVVTLRPAGGAGVEPDAAGLKAWCASRLEPHAVPARIVVADALARNGNGKIDKQLLRQKLASRPAAVPPPPLSSTEPETAIPVAIA
ncbi:class I adenylate-forming enzyme family protein [Azospirillum sp. HJ39]|uniref:class I adenylate-forming enzyme family protein n=1 Tax=Azospirillum sp. HJ39 TaxID=3159496 RepID=UPI0035575CF0